MPSGPELSNTRLTTLPNERWLRFLLRERDLEDLIVPIQLVRRVARTGLGSDPAGRAGRRPGAFAEISGNGTYAG